MKFLDNAAKFLNENFAELPSANNLVSRIPNYHAVDKQIINNNSNESEISQLISKAELTLMQRNYLLNQVDTIANFHLSNTIKEVIINQGFNDICGKNGIEVIYDDEKNKEKSKRFTKDIKKFNKKHKVLELLKDCTHNEGLDYCEIFWSTPVENGRGITEVYDDMDVRQHLAVYKNTDLIGALRFQFDARGNKMVDRPSWVNSNDFTHFVLNYKKISIKINKSYDKQNMVPEKLRCAMPILAPVVDLVKQYNQLEQTSTALEILKATQPLVLQMNINSDQDNEKSMTQLQNWTNLMNSSRNNIINNLNTYNISTVLSEARKFLFVPRGTSTGDNEIKPIEIDYGNSDLSKKMNDIKKTIASAVGVPEYYIAITSGGTKDTKEDTLLTNPRFSGMLTKIQQQMTKGLVNMYYKHLRHLYMDEVGTPLEKVDKDCIRISFKSTTNLNNRLESEEMILSMEAANNYLKILEEIASSPSLNQEIVDEEFIKVWEMLTVRYPHVQKSIRQVPPEVNKNNVISHNTVANTILDEHPIEKESSDKEANNQPSKEEANNASKQPNEDGDNNSKIEDIRNVFK